MGADASRQLKKNRRNGLRHSEFRRQCGRGARAYGDRLHRAFHRLVRDGVGAVRSNPRRRSGCVLVRGRGEGRTRREWGGGSERQGDKEKGDKGKEISCPLVSPSPCPLVLVEALITSPQGACPRRRSDPI